jgi:hypothetical protein
MAELKMTHVLLLAVAAFLMYHSIGGCGNGFSLGGQDSNGCYINCCGISTYDCNYKKQIDNAYQNCKKITTINEQLNDVGSQLSEVLDYLSDFKYKDGIKCNNLPPSN